MCREPVVSRCSGPVAAPCFSCASARRVLQTPPAIRGQRPEGAQGRLGPQRLPPPKQKTLNFLGTLFTARLRPHYYALVWTARLWANGSVQVAAQVGPVPVAQRKLSAEAARCKVLCASAPRRRTLGHAFGKFWAPGHRGQTRLAMNRNCVR